MGARTPSRARSASILAAACLVALIAERSLRSAPFAPERAELLLVIACKTALLLSPIALARLALGLRREDLGLGSPRPRVLTLEVPLLAVGAAILGALLARLPSVQATYPLYAPARADPWLFLVSTVVFTAYGFAWELFFRGALLFGLEPLFGRASLLVQAVLFALAHLDKPGVELALSLPAGVAFGLLAWRANSALAPFLVHLSLSLSVNLASIALQRPGGP